MRLRGCFLATRNATPPATSPWPTGCCQAGQLRGHWRGWGEQLLRGPGRSKPFVAAHRAAVARVLGPPRLHHTIVTGEVISKEAAGEYALGTFGDRWEPLLRTALAHRAGRSGVMAPDEVIRAAGEFTLEVVSDAESRV